MSTRRKKVTPRPGDVFAFRLKDGSLGVGHVVALEIGLPSCVLLAKRVQYIDELADSVDEALREPIGVLVTADPLFRSGDWPIVAQREPNYRGIIIPRPIVGQRTFTAGYVPGFVEAYYGLRAWDEYPKLAAWYREILLPELPIPATARCLGTSPARGATSERRDTPLPSRPAVTDGPAELHIQLVYPGTGYPSIDLLRRRQQMEDRLEQSGAGEVLEAGAGGGVMHVFLRTGDVRRAVPLVEKIAAEMGFADDMLIETAPIEDDEDSEDDAGA